MHIGIIGAGNMGAALGTLWARAGHDVTFSYTRDADALAARVGALAGTVSGVVRVGTPRDAATADVVMLAVPFAQLDDALGQAGANGWSITARVLLTCVSPLRPDFSGTSTGIAGSGELSAAEQIARRVPGVAVVEAFNLTFAELLAAPDRRFPGGMPSLPYCGDDADAKATAAYLIDEAGFEGVDVGPLRVARSLEALASVWVQTAVVGGLFPQVGLRLLRR